MFDADQASTISHIFSNERKGRDFIEKILNNKLSMEEIEEVCTIINSEFVLNGLLPDWEANEYGKKLESILDIVNRPRLCS